MVYGSTKNLMKRVQKSNLGNLAKFGGFQFTNTFFPYTSGQIGPYYVQSTVVEKGGWAYSRAIRDMGLLIQDVLSFGDKYTFGIISGGESRDWDFSNPVAVAMEKPHFKIYKDGRVLGADVKGRKVVHVADLNNEGSSPRDLWVPAIRKAEGIIDYIFFFVDRMEDGVEEMQKLGLQSYSVVPLDGTAWDFLREWDVVDSEVYHSLKKRGSTKEERKEWAIDMLRSDSGLETLANLFRNPKTKGKGWKIMDKGYPDLKKELIREVERRGIELLEVKD